ncbi:MAG TPA: hypothetical protein VMU10_07505 [Desulfomonilia bacterium]|nr:hypothetical protein [Desulfomonilia bacterium]
MFMVEANTKRKKNIMEPLPESLVDETLNEIILYDAGRASQEMIEFGKVQPDLLSFILEFSEDMGEQAEEKGIFMLFVVYHIFRKGYGREIGRVTEEEIISSFEENQRLMENLERAQEEFFNRVAEVQLSTQPYVIRYVIDTLSEESEEDEPEPLSEEEMGYLFILLKTVIDVLNRKTGE